VSHLQTKEIQAGDIRVGGRHPPLFIAGPDTLESEELALEIARELRRLRERFGLGMVFKGSYDKANRSSHLSYRGPGLERGLEILRRVKESTGLPVTSDVHTVGEVARAASVLDIIQIPAFLCRQNDLLAAAGAAGRIVNIKKGQFLPPRNVKGRVAAALGPATPGVIVTERGTTFGHGDLVNDFRGVVEIRAAGIPLV
jgi:2-dehydro-3-deoxyphosphooctonate aldolase (KDO 8-P synthase)